ncbi:DUF6541 family protein [Ornithinimicrobium tianjinense]|uniref:Uncharacterized protein n=1 Tax=Ornithinimicrobium tianjinense TaxID=1195761 RepID=A0A917BJS7_9MICO|nr:DUF6541 family protein [Ornithinimicrobium tianjinense]GGF46232.1 hypothetical protein GCM10011366_12460 [Ornithinimicrobium tianjinense]
MSWGEALPGLLGLTVLWVLPGYAVLRLLGFRGLLALGGGAPVTSGLSGTLAIGYGLVGLRWSLPTLLLGLLVAVLAAALVGRLLGTTQDPSGVTVAGERRLRHTERSWLALTWTLGGGALAAAMTAGMGRADQPPQAWDAVFHLNALWFVRQTGEASSLGGLAPMYADLSAPFYPATWHGLVAVAPFFPRVTEAANSSSVVLGSVVWIAGLVALSRVVWPARALPTVLVPVLAACYVTFPAIAVSMLAVWPFALSVACVPGTIALLIATVRGVLSWRMHLALALGLAWAVAGVVLAHPSGLFSLVLLALPLLTVLLARQLWRVARLGAPVRAAVLMTTWVVAIVGTLVFLLNFPPVRSIMDYQRGGQDSYLPGLGSLLIDHPLIYVYKITSVNLVGTVLVLLGAVLAVRWRHARWLVVSLVAAAVLTLLAAGPPEQPLRTLAGFWYTQASRINQLLVIPAVLLAAGAGSWLSRAVARRVGAPLWAPAALLVIGIVTLTSGLRWESQTQVMASTYTTYPIAWGTILEPEEIAMIDRAAEVLPDDAVVLGEPVAGSPYLLNRADVQVVFPQLSPIPDSPERTLLEQHFDDWATEPGVCEAVRALGVTHVYADTLTFEDPLNAKYEETTPGLYLLRPMEGEDWRKLDEGGHASLWEFHGCDAP